VIVRKLIVLLALCGTLALPAAAQADFGFVPGSVEVTAENKDGTIDTEASSHPYGFSVHFEMKTDELAEPEGGPLRNVLVELPPGFVGNPQAPARCSRHLFEGNLPQCPVSTQVGFLRAIVRGIGQINGPVYNLVPPPGIATKLGFIVHNFN
jgi:hypothetical protein